MLQAGQAGSLSHIAATAPLRFSSQRSGLCVPCVVMPLLSNAVSHAVRGDSHFQMHESPVKCGTANDERPFCKISNRHAEPAFLSGVGPAGVCTHRTLECRKIVAVECSGVRDGDGESPGDAGGGAAGKFSIASRECWEALLRLLDADADHDEPRRSRMECGV